MKRWILILLLLFPAAVMAQDVTETQEPAAQDYAFEFPLPVPSQAQIDEAYDCVLAADESDEVGTGDSLATQEANAEVSLACDLANQALAMADARGDDEKISDEELALVNQLIENNPALALRLSVIAAYYNAEPFVSAPEIAAQPITALHFKYKFAGLGPSNDYDVTITNADKTPKIGGKLSIEGGEDGTPALELPQTIDSEVVQAFGGALTDLFPIEKQFSSIPCWDYYPSWTIELTFADKTKLTLDTHDSNVIGIGGPWQVEIDGQNYMQYSSALNNAVLGLFDAMELPFGETAAMGCGGMNEPLYDAFPRAAD